MMLWKLNEKGMLIKAENIDEHEAIEKGYKPLSWTPMPEDESNYSEHWEEGESAIVRVWTKVHDEQDIDPTEIAEALENIV